MKLAEKIFQQRKKLGLSQEQFAERMEISRQAVSKWESGQSMPDLDKLVMMSQIFGVSTDYLLKEDEDSDFSQQNTDVVMEKNEDSVRTLSEEEVENYQRVTLLSSKKIAFGVFLCIVGAALTLGAEMLFSGFLSIDEDVFVALPILVCVAVAIGQFIPAGMQLEKYEYLEKEHFMLPLSLQIRLTSEADEYQAVFAKRITTGIILVIIGVIACVAMEAVTVFTGNQIWEEYVGSMVLLVFVAFAVSVFIISGMKKNYYDVILQEDDYSVKKKKNSSESDDVIGMVASIYWCIVTAGYLAYSFLTEDWGRSWIVWPVAGCIFGAIAAFISLYGARNKEEW